MTDRVYTGARGRVAHLIPPIAGRLRFPRRAGRLVDKGAPVDTMSVAWGRQAEALNAAETVAAMRGEGGVESLRRWLWDDIQAGGV